MQLLKYDTRNIRVFEYKDAFIQFSHLQNSLLPLAPIIFASSATIKISDKQISQCNHLINLINNTPHQLTITYKNSLLTIFYQYPSGEKIDHHFSEEISSLWIKRFQDLSKQVGLYKFYNLEDKGRALIEEFFQEISISLPTKTEYLQIVYTDQFLFIPFEFLYKYYYIHFLLPAKESSRQKQIIKNLAIMYDPNLELAHQESLYLFKLLEKRDFKFNNSTPDIAFISAHGIIKNQNSCLQNQELQSLILEISPYLIVFNSCLIAQQNEGIIQEYLNRGCIVIASPFFTLCSKTIFSPLLRFLTNTSPDSIRIAFDLLRIFYPNIYQYFRIYFPFATNHNQ